MWICADMNNETVDDEIGIRYRFKDGFHDRVVEDNNINGWTYFRISTADYNIIGGDRDGSRVTGHPVSVFWELLDSIQKMRSDEQSFVEFTYGPVYVVLEPQDDITVQVASSVLYKGIENPEERLDIDTERVVTREAWTAAVIETTNELIDEVVAINSAVKSISDFELLREKLDKVTS